MMGRTSWRRLLGIDSNDQGAHWRNEAQRLLPGYGDEEMVLAISPVEATKISLRLRYLVEQCVPCELEEDAITRAHSHIITSKVVQAAKEAGGPDNGACVVFCLLVNYHWFKKQALLELWDADLHNVRAVACEVLGKRIYSIEGEEDQDYLFEQILLKRYSILVNGEHTPPTNVVEKAVDLHALRICGSSGYQQCVSYLWKGWIQQDENDPTKFVNYRERSNTSYWIHVNPDRMRVPAYQNATQIIISFAYLALYTGAINTINPTGDLDSIEALLYLFTFGFLCDEFSKFWKVGRYYFSFWNAFNLTLYALMTTSLVTRLVALSYPSEDHEGGPRDRYNHLSYNFLAFSAPMFWMRLLLYLDTYRFFGTMLVVLKVMMKESIIFFALLIVVIIGFLQAFIGMDQIDNDIDATTFILKAIANAIMQSPDFGGFEERFTPPFGIILYYLLTFIIMIVLLNVLIALYNSAYESITDNAVDEYMALYAQKTMQFVRAPDENVFIAPFNIIEIFCLVIPFEWWLPRRTYQRLNDYVMAVIYSPLLLAAAWVEQRSAKRIRMNRRRFAGEDDNDEDVQEWEQLVSEVDFESDGWAKKCDQVKSNVEQGPTEVQVRALRSEVTELREMLKEALNKKD